MTRLDPSPPFKIFVGFDHNEMMACTIGVESIRRSTHAPIDVRRISRQSLHPNYQRPTELRDDGRLWDLISAAPMSTDHALARFFIPWLCDYRGWALFTDGDILCRRDIAELFALADDGYAVLCVQHPPLLTEGLKKDGAIQTAYPRKNWSSVLLFNCSHPANQTLSLDVLNTQTGRWLHGFSWLGDNQIGELPAEWNYLANVSLPQSDPAIVHYTLGVPTQREHADAPFATEWWAMAGICGYAVPRTALDVAAFG